MIISKTPLRASFFGGGTDFRDFFETTEIGYGSTVSTALNMYIYIMVNKRFDDKIRISYRIQELVDNVDEVEHNIIREAMKIAGVERGVDIVYSADIPISSSGIGLASSSAMAVGVLNALFAYKGVCLSPDKLAQHACEIEIDRLKNPIGIQDQYAVAYGGLKRYRYYASGEVSVANVICKKEIMEILKRRLMLFYTGVNRISSHILSDQKQNIKKKCDVLNEMVGMVDESIALLERGDLHKWGAMLDKAWTLKKQMSTQISTSLIDEMYIKAKVAGAIGGKVLGAGGGGFLLLYVPEEKQEIVRDELREYRLVNFNFEDEGSRIIFME
ncbi:GHMP family kinase ATP-binding protein [Schwartzia succinivorans]|jgi:D-glycero-alpha-D-manno-heptose-7-phosphate kinase|uniref:D-glycero-alpha-D-manno-heptose-7-phosphate kinase n=1 Tax=Schwartzia succinivorans DSM 10502 TaxID=1123243 RepID=A0A1M4XPA8_9FIRM|nr:GHMP kinase [Schwartzia succinivorans]SHE95339.1 D-glycero-alpha-D-manno-heptose-7-phosphate kinase [Schwartzia succinivorans DSM 10502]